MFTIKMLNNISEKGLNLLPEDNYIITNDCSNPDAIIVRSANMLDMEFPDNLKAIARAGAGVNNIPIDKCTERGIVVFNTPGANANGVKELVIASLFLSSRKIYQGINWVKSLKGLSDDEIAAAVEKEKCRFEGPEVKGKRIGVIGLGAIGVAVANDAVSLGMEVMGYDPFISINSAWGLSRHVIRATNLDNLLATCDYITIHTPLNNKTRGMLNKDKFDIMKKGVRILNFARGELVVVKDLLEAIEKDTVACYITDFPESSLIDNEKVITIPHLGASTIESEDNCAIMAVEQLRNFLEKGIIKNSVNFPECELEYQGHTRITTVHTNKPNMVGQVTTVIAQNKINIDNMLTHHRETIGYNIIDIEGEVGNEVIESIRKIDGVKRVRVINYPDINK